MKAEEIRVVVEGEEKMAVYVTGPFKETVARVLARYLKAEEGDGAEAITKQVEIEVR